MTTQPDFKALCQEASRLYYYGRHDGLADVMRRINAALADSQRNLRVPPTL